MNKLNYDIYKTDQEKIIKSWTKDVQFEESAIDQTNNIANMPFIYKWVAIMPDVHTGIGVAIGSVIPTSNAIIPAAVGVDIGCGMMAQKLSLKASDLPDNLFELRSNIERAVPNGLSRGRKSRKRKKSRDKGSWLNPPENILIRWRELENVFNQLCIKYELFKDTNNLNHLGTLGSGNHFIEICLDENSYVWIMLHSGSRGVGNKIGRHFIELAKKNMEKQKINLPDKNLAYLEKGSDHFYDYLMAVEWAQDFAHNNREIMMENTIKAIKHSKGIPEFKLLESAINCHHNYVQKEFHYGKEVFVTRKGAVRAGKGDLGIIPGSMGAKSFIVRGLGNQESFCSCSHGAGRLMSRTKAKEVFSIKDHEKATQGVECRKDSSIIDETPGAYKPIDKVMKAQNDLVEIITTLKQVICVKG